MSQDTQPRPVSPRDSTTPLISSAQREASQQNEDSSMVIDSANEETDPKTGKRRFFGIGKKKDGKTVPKEMALPASATSEPMSTTGEIRDSSPGLPRVDLKPQGSQPIPISPSRSPYPSNIAASPSRLRSASPRLHSPASSEIFERNVQEPVHIAQLQGELSPAHIPSHVITEDHIPPALEATAEAITSEELDPDEVEIVMSASHQPAVSILESSASQADLTSLNTPMSNLHHVTSEDSSMHQSGIIPIGGEEDGTSSYGQLDPNDVRRLSFISFADVVQSEHQAPPTSAMSEAGNRDSLHISNLPSSIKQERASSPLRNPPHSPTSTSGGVTTPPPGVSLVSSNPDSSPGRSVGMTSPISPHSELTIETMRQAVRKTASGDLSGGRSQLASPISDDNLSNPPRSRTNS